MAEKNALDMKKEGREETGEHSAPRTEANEHEVDAKEAKDHPYREWTEEALFEKAKAVGIEGYADMDSEELITALNNL
jgi:hypothetical protein